jgi:hypothetical protein
MGTNQDALSVMRAALCDQIERIMEDLPTLAPARLVREIDTIRETARDCGLAPLSELARSLGRALSGGEGMFTTRPFLETMRDAVGCERFDPAATQSFLASVNSRLHG